MRDCVSLVAKCSHLLKPLGGVCLCVSQHSSTDSLPTKEPRHRCASPLGSQQHIQNDQDMREDHNRCQLAPRFAP